MSGTKPIASLGPLLLARKGTAKPAMRAAAAALHTDSDIAACQEDLGWNDMGDTSDMLIVHPQAPKRGEPVTHIEEARQARRNSARRAAQDHLHRSAFTLRLDTQRHLKLKLASAISGESAQHLVTQALDQFLADMTEVETLAAQVKRNGKKA